MRLALSAILFSLAAPALPQHPLNGTWKSDPAKAQLSARPDIFQVKDGVYSCQSCVPTAYQVAADGAFHRVAGRDYWDELAVDASEPDALTLRFRRAGKDVGSSGLAVSADGKTLTRTSRSADNPEGVPIDSSATYTRVSPAAAGAHQASGGWRMAKLGSQSDAGLTVSYRIEGETVRSTTPTGENYTARIGGPAMPIEGDPSGLMVKVSQPEPGRLEEVFMRGDEVQSVSLLTPSPDGRTVTARVTDKRTGAVTTYTATRQ